MGSTQEQQAEARRAALPVIRYPEDLPVSIRRDEIAEALRKHQVIVVAGETGSGKTTQIPKICLECGFGVNGLIGHTQPRRLAARSVAARIAEELNEPLGQGVGFQVRFSDQSSEKSWIKLMTDGILLNEIQQDRMLRKYEVLIIDEAHERSLNIDFLLGYLKRLTRKRPDLKVIITSATIDVEKFSAHFDQAPIISVTGRSFPVDIHYQDPDDLPEAVREEDSITGPVLHALREIEAMDRKRGRPGDVLVFLSGEREIRDVAQALRRKPMANTEVLPLYARLSQKEQKRIFESHRGRRVVLSTNVAETSLTVPGIVYVIDTGLARISRYSVSSKVQRLPIEPVSQASANQRAGRCGRVAPGVCIRLYSEEDFLQRPEFTDPEIQRTNLSAVILQMLQLRLGEIEDFPFVEPPDRRSINDGFRLLAELGAINAQRRITRIGRQMARLPADPRLARMLVEAGERNCLYELLIIVSALGVQEPRESPVEKRDAARQRHQQFAHEKSDFLSYVNLWQTYEEQRQALSQSQLRKYCKENFLNFMRMREWRETHRQLMLACQKLDIRPGQGGEDYESVHRSIIRGSLNQIGQKTPEKHYLGSRGRQFLLFPTSVLAKKKPRWIVAAELIETSRLFATLAASIEPGWVVDAAGDLLKREYFEPHWEKKQGQVVAYEKISLFGLVLIEKRAVNYGPIDPVISRQIFIQEALVPLQINTRQGFLKANQGLVADIRHDEEKLRRPDIMISDEEVAAFYEERIPAQVFDAQSFEAWSRQVRTEKNRTLYLQREDLLQREPDSNRHFEFPDQTTIQHNRLQIRYRFEPGNEEDGASIDVPLPLLGSLAVKDIEWSVPGTVAERCVALVKGLPKSQRKQFIPVPEFVDQALADVEPGRQELCELLREQARCIKGVDVPAHHWEQATLPPHLRIKIRVLDEDGKLLGKGEELAELQHRFAGSGRRQREVLAEPDLHPLHRSGARDWDEALPEKLPREVRIEEQITLIRYPALIDEGDAVGVQLLDSVEEADEAHRRGLARLLMLRTTQQRQQIRKDLQALRKQVSLKFPPQLEDFTDHALYAVYRESFDLDRQRPRDRDEFMQLYEQGRSELMENAARMVRQCRDIFERHFDMRRRFSDMNTSRYPKAMQDIDQQLDELLPADFPAAVPAGWLKEYPRYLRAIVLRLEKLPQDPRRDQEGIRILQGLHSRYRECCSANRTAAARLETFPCLLQELRVSLFAQSLRTRVPVSEKRLLRRLEEAVR